MVTGFLTETKTHPLSVKTKGQLPEYAVGQLTVTMELTGVSGKYISDSLVSEEHLITDDKIDVWIDG